MGAETTQRGPVNFERITRTISITQERAFALERIASAKGVTLDRVVSEAIRDDVAPGTLASMVTLRRESGSTMVRWYTMTMSKAYFDALDVRRALRGDTRMWEGVINGAITRYIAKEEGRELNRHAIQVTRHGH